MLTNDDIDILFDLSGHTAFNRLDIFSFKPAPIQVTYIGYPFTTGLNEMDYRITDNICDGDHSISQKFYTEKLVNLKNCFLCYDPAVIKRGDQNQTSTFIFPELNEAPHVKNKNKLVIGCFNRVKKITDTVIEQFNQILKSNKNVHFVFKTKALINPVIKKTFLNKFDKSVQKRITTLDCTLSHEEHLGTYNQVDIAIDTAPYSGTTTSCEALFMGVPVFSLYDKIFHFHPQNVTVSILKNSGLDFYVCDNNKEIIDKIKILEEKPIEFWKTLKEDTRKQFLNGKVCDKSEYLQNIQALFIDLFNKHRLM
jgi:predicted O-linked N-acetylglucosamine transferase (SPINDLY family)